VDVLIDAEPQIQAMVEMRWMEFFGIWPELDFAGYQMRYRARTGMG